MNSCILLQITPFINFIVLYKFPPRLLLVVLLYSNKDLRASKELGLGLNHLFLFKHEKHSSNDTIRVDIGGLQGLKKEIVCFLQQSEKIGSR